MPEDDHLLPAQKRQLERLDLMSEWLDRRYLDPLLGFLVPGLGDALPSLLGLYGVFVALQLKCHPIVVARMLLNLGADSLLGSIPLVGVVFDVFFRAHEKNLTLLRDRTQRGEPQVTDWLLVLSAVAVLVFCVFVVPLLLLGALAYVLTRWASG